MKNKVWVVGLLSFMVGVSGTLGTQWLLENISQASNSSTIDYQYAGFEDQFNTVDKVSWDEFSELHYPQEDYRSYPDEIYDNYDWEEISRLQDDSYFVIYNKFENVQGLDIRYTSFIHLSQSLTTLWEYDFIPSDTYILKMSEYSTYFFDFDVHELEIIGNQAIIGAKFNQIGGYFDSETQTIQHVFIGDNFLPIGAQENSDSQDMSVALAINLDNYAFDVLEIFDVNDAFDVTWREFLPIDEDLLVFTEVTSTDPGAGITIFGANLDGELKNYYFFFRYAIDSNQAIQIEHLGHIRTNLEVELDWNDIHDFSGHLYESLDNRMHVSLNFEYRDWYEPYEFGEPLLVDFSDGFDLITSESRSEIEAYFQNFELTLITEDINVNLHTLMDVETFDIFHEEIVHWSIESTQNEVWMNVDYYYESEDDFAIVITEETFNYLGVGVWGYQLIAGNSTIYQYVDGALAIETTFSDSLVFLVHGLIRTESHFIFVGTTSKFDLIEFDNEFIPSGIVLLATRDFIILDTFVIDTDAPTYFEGIYVNETVLTLHFWSTTQKPEFDIENPEFNWIFKIDLTLILD